MSISNMKDLKDLEFEFQLYDLYSDVVEDIRKALQKISEKLDNSMLRGPLFAMVHELAVNALKALYKRSYFTHLVSEIGLDDLPYEDWLRLFKSELEEHKAENFARLCRKENIKITVHGYFLNNNLVLDIRNEGVPTEIEMRRLQNAVRHARNLENFEYLFSQTEEEEIWKEGGNIGIPMIIMTLRGLGVSPGNFNIFTEKGSTCARITLPLLSIQKNKKRTIVIMKHNRHLLSLVWDIFTKINFSVVQFDLNGNLISVSENLLTELEIPHEQVSQFEKLIPEEFYTGLFTGPQGIKFIPVIQNYRTTVSKFNSDEKILYNISGYKSEEDGHNEGEHNEGEHKDVVNMVWHAVHLDKKGDQLEGAGGSILENLRVHNMIKPYVHPLVLRKAHEMAKIGKFRLPEEVKESTIFFADIVGFTQKAEKMKPNVAIELLNTALDICVHAITQHDGQIDKFMGDAVMAIFEEPLNAVIAAIEIQNQYGMLNELRKINTQDPILIRIGINTGTIIMGNVGNKDRMDWTSIGDVVNTASRIEKSADAGSVVIGEQTYKYVKDHVRVDKMFTITVKGKKKQLTLYSTDEVVFHKNGKKIFLNIREHMTSE